MGFSRTSSQIGWHKLLLIGCLPILAMLLQQQEVLKYWDNQIYDKALAMFSYPDNQDIVIIAVDEYSLERQGKWPWPRQTHAQLVDLLTDAGVKAIGLDIIFAEYATFSSVGDERLVEAVKNSGKVILPVVPEQEQAGKTLKVTLPWQTLSKAAAGLGHVDVPIDDDGLVRSANLQAGTGGSMWPSFALSIYQLDETRRQAAVPGIRRPNGSASVDAWRRDFRIEIPFSASAGHFRYLSYTDVLADAELRVWLHDKYVLVGVTAAGLAPTFATPMHEQTGLIPGVEINAYVLEALIFDRTIQDLPRSWNLLLTLLLVATPLIGLHFFHVSRVLPVTLGFCGLAVTACALLLNGLHYWFGPSPVMLILSIHYVLWNWRRLRLISQLLFRERQSAQTALDSIGDAVITTNAQGTIGYLNPAAEKLIGCRFDGVHGKSLGAVVQLFDNEEKNSILGFDEYFDKLLRGEYVMEKAPRYIVNNLGEEYAIHVTGSPIMNNSNKVSGMVFALNDITGILHTNRKVAFLATHDSLTGLANRVLFYEQFEKAIATAKRQGHYLAVLFIDLDDFKRVNDGMGHAVGDLLLIEVAERLLTNTRRADTVARWGSDEFVVLLNQLPQEVNITGIAIKILERLSEPFYFDGLTLYVTPSIGISVFPKDGTRAEQLLNFADAAMFQVKENGRNGFGFFRSNFNKSAKQRLVMEKEMYAALSEGHFDVYYQPQIDPVTNRVAGAEALLRWPHPHKGFISLNTLIPMAEETGLINAIGDWVMNTVCRQLSDWRKQGLGDVTVAVNLSPRQFLQSDLCNKIEWALKTHNVAGSSVKVEITESLMIKNIDKVAKMLWDIRSLGVSISIDDFGTGYSSLSVLKNFPIDQLKIDKSFISHLDINANDANIAQSIILLGHNMNMQVVAEGVETRTQLDYLLKWRCDFIQGYHFSPPLPASKMTDVLRMGQFLRVP